VELVFPSNSFFATDLQPACSKACPAPERNNLDRKFHRVEMSSGIPERMSLSLYPQARIPKHDGNGDWVENRSANLCREFSVSQIKKVALEKPPPRCTLPPALLWLARNHC
jgi:hypothetical protein